MFINFCGDRLACCFNVDVSLISVFVISLRTLSRCKERAGERYLCRVDILGEAESNATMQLMYYDRACTLEQSKFHPVSPRV